MDGDDTGLREATPADEAGLAALSSIPDGGSVAFSAESHVPAHLMLGGNHDRSVRVVAERGVPARIVGSARLDLGTCRFEGAVVDYALLSELLVHPAHRRRGVAAALAQWRLARAAELAGDQVCVVAYVQ